MHTSTSPTTPTPRRARRRGRFALGLGIAAGLTALWAAPSAALLTEADSVTIRSVGYDLGDDTWDAATGRPLGSATVEWHHAWYAVVPQLHGFMHFEGVSGECTRVRMISYDADDVSLGSDYSDDKCANTNGHDQRVVEEGVGHPLIGRPGAASVDVILQHETPNGWTRVGSTQHHVYGPIIDSDLFKIDGDELNFGAGAFVDAEPDGHPADKAQVLWNSSGGPIRASVMGDLFMEDAENLCARVRVRYQDDDENTPETDLTTLETDFSPEYCPASDAVDEEYVQISTFTSNEVDRVQVTLQQRGGSGVWENDGSKTLLLN